jgi:hypothetical protein
VIQLAEAARREFAKGVFPTHFCFGEDGPGQVLTEFVLGSESEDTPFALQDVFCDDIKSRGVCNRSPR